MTYSSRHSLLWSIPSSLAKNKAIACLFSSQRAKYRRIREDRRGRSRLSRRQTQMMKLEQLRIDNFLQASADVDNGDILPCQRSRIYKGEQHTRQCFFKLPLRQLHCLQALSKQPYKYGWAL